MMRNVMRLALAAVLLASMGLVGVGSAQAAGGCTKGFACLWAGRSYTGTTWGNSNNSGTFDMWSTGSNDVASSAWANGGTCRYTTWYINGGQTGNWFYLQSQSIFGAGYSDPNLSNGAGYGQYNTQNFEDKLSSYKYSGC